jgi:hypothetical protein
MESNTAGTQINYSDRIPVIRSIAITWFDFEPCNIWFFNSYIFSLFWNLIYGRTPYKEQLPFENIIIVFKANYFF